MPCARMRPATSLGPPAANGTTRESVPDLECLGASAEAETIVASEQSGRADKFGIKRLLFVESLKHFLRQGGGPKIGGGPAVFPPSPLINQPACKPGSVWPRA